MVSFSILFWKPDKEQYILELTQIILNVILFCFIPSPPDGKIKMVALTKEITLTFLSLTLYGQLYGWAGNRWKKSLRHGWATIPSIRNTAGFIHIFIGYSRWNSTWTKFFELSRFFFFICIVLLSGKINICCNMNNALVQNICVPLYGCRQTNIPQLETFHICIFPCSSAEIAYFSESY